MYTYKELINIVSIDYDIQGHPILVGVFLDENQSRPIHVFSCYPFDIEVYMYGYDRSNYRFDFKHF